MTKQLSITPGRCHPEHREGSMQFARAGKLPVSLEGAGLQSRRQAVDSTQQAPQESRFWVAQPFQRCDDDPKLIVGFSR